MKSTSPDHNMKHIRFNVYSVNKLLTIILLVLTISTALYILKLCYRYEVSFINQCHVELTTHPAQIIKGQEIKNSLLQDYHSQSLLFRQQFNCRKLFEDDPKEQEKTILYRKLHHNQFKTFEETNVPSMLSDCQTFKTIRGYRQDYGAHEEREYPLAYIITVHKDFQHLERLLRALYMPQHTICIHLDANSSGHLKAAVASLVGCFENVALASEPQTIIYAHISRLRADIVCMKDLLELDSKWKYLINYAATEYPLRTNLETVKILKSLQNRNDIHESFKARIIDRFKTEYTVVNGKMVPTKIPLEPPPHNLTITKGQAYNAFTREFVEWALSERIPLDLLKWSEKTYSPDEHYWGTLNNLYHNAFLNTPGGFKDKPDKKGYITKFISWQTNSPRFKCHGKIIHSICIFSSLDLPTLMVQMHLAANKFDLTYDPIAYACIEELYENRTLADLPFNLAFYKGLHFVTYNS